MTETGSIHWLLQSFAEQPALREGNAPDGLLSEAERARLETLRIAKRRREWLLGRSTAKRLIQALLAKRGHAVALDAIEIVNSPDGVPEARLSAPLNVPLSLSISHSGDRACCASCTSMEMTVGMDIERVEPRDDSFIDTFFSDQERDLVTSWKAAERDLLTTIIWSAKEAALKALRLGLSVDTIRLSCIPAAASAAMWNRVDFRLDHGLLPGSQARHELSGWWRVEDGYVLTLALLHNEGTEPAGPRAFAISPVSAVP